LLEKWQRRVAQRGERHAYTVEVTGSSPVPPTREKIGENLYINCCILINMAARI
jgi:hypothetical protein